MPQSIAEVATATADLNTELGLTGPALDEATKAALTYGRVFDGDVGGIIADLSDTMGIFHVDASNFARGLDAMTVASQATGISVDRLTGHTQTFGPVLKNLGFSMNESAAIMAQMSGAGIDLGRVFPALNQASRRWARDGITDLRGQLEKTIEQIQGAETSSEKLALAQDAFGAQGAQRMINFIEQGGFAIDDLVASMEGAEGTIEGLGLANLTLGDRFGLLRNKVSIALEPIARAAFDMAAAFLDRVVPAVDAATQWLGDHLPDAVGRVDAVVRPVIERVAAVVGELAQAFIQRLAPALQSVGRYLSEQVPRGLQLVERVATPVIQAFRDLAGIVRDQLVPPLRQFTDWFRQNESAMQALGIAVGTVLVVAFGALAVSAGAAAVSMIAATAPVLALVAAIGALGAGLFLLIRHWDDVVEKFPIVGQAADMVRDAFNRVVSAGEAIVAFAQQHLPGAVQVARSALNSVVSYLRDPVLPALQNIASGTLAVAGAVIDAHSWIFEQVSRYWPQIWGVVEPILRQLENLVTTVFAVVTGAIDAVIKLLAGDFSGAWDATKGVLSAVVDFWFATLENGIDLIRGLFGLMWTVGWDLVTSLYDGAVGMLTGTVLPWFAGLPGQAVSAVGSVVSTLTGKGKDLLTGLWDGAKEIFEDVRLWFVGLPARIVTAIGSIGRLLWDIGRSIITGLWDGMKSVWSDVTGWVGGLGGTIASLKGPIEEDRKLLVNEGAAIMEGLAAGMGQGFQQYVVPQIEASTAELYGAGEDIGTAVTDGAITAIQWGSQGVLDEVSRLIYAMRDHIAVEAPSVADSFVHAMDIANVRREWVDEFGDLGADIVMALTDVISGHGDPLALARLVNRLIDEGEAAGIPGIRELGEDLTRTLADALALSSPELVNAAINAIKDLVDAMDVELDEGMEEVARTGIDAFMDGWRGAQRDRRMIDTFGSDGKRLLDAINDAIETGSPDTWARIGSMADGILQTLTDGLDPSDAAYITRLFMGTLRDVIEAEGGNALDALADMLKKIEDAGGLRDGGASAILPGDPAPTRPPVDSRTMGQRVQDAIGDAAWDYLQEHGRLYEWSPSGQMLGGHGMTDLINMAARGLLDDKQFGSTFQPFPAAEGLWRVPGPGGAGDIFPAMLSPGEMVLPDYIAEAVRTGGTRGNSGSDAPVIHMHLTVQGSVVAERDIRGIVTDAISHGAWASFALRARGLR